MLTIRRIVHADELKRYGELEGEYHYMGETHSGGDTMRLVIEEDGVWVALMTWGSACYHLKPRDEYVGWPNSLRAERQKLVVSNRRFTILAGPGERRNLASRCLGLACRELPALWQAAFRYRPLLAETFCDIERSGGTCYRAANWIPVGQTRGFSRVNRQSCDFYVPNGRPKAVWLKPLVPDAVGLLSARDLPEECLRGAASNADGVMPIDKARRESLLDAMCDVRDTRDDNRSFPIGAMLTLVVMATMSGANSVKAIARFAKRLTMPQRKELCLPHAKNAAGVMARHEYKVPSYVTIYKFLRKLDLEDFARKLSAWMAAEDGHLPRQLALDGKYVKDVVGIVSVVNAETGAPVSVGLCSRKEGEGEKCEMRVGRSLLASMDLDNALVSSDALHCQQETAREIVCAGGEHLVQIKGNQAGIVRKAEDVVRARHPVGVKKKTRRDTGGSSVA